MKDLSSFLLFKLTAKDAAAVSDLEKACFSCAWSEEQYAKALRNNPCIAGVGCSCTAFFHRELAGYIVYYQTEDEFEILNIAVYPKWRGLGLATALLTQVLREAIKKGIKKCFLEVRRSNLPALHLYNRAGFLQVGLRRHYYPTGEDALVMVYHPQKSCLGVRGDVSESSD